MDTPATAPARSIPINLYKPQTPLLCRLIQNERLTPEGFHADVRHLVFETSAGDLRYLEGQSVGIVTPGVDDQGKPHKLRLYSIASTRDGDNADHRTVSLCVKRVVYDHPETGETMRGPASNYLCDLSPGDVAEVTGPVGRTFLLPEDPEAHLVMVATGTGIAPFRGFLRRLFRPGSAFKGQAHLFFGMQTSHEILYRSEFEALLAEHPNFRLTYAISREQKAASGRNMYVQDRLREQAPTMWPLLDDPRTCVYICGLKGMEDGIDAACSEMAEQHGVDWLARREAFKRSKRWQVETY